MLDYQPIDPPVSQAIVVTASRTEEEQADSAASSTVIDSATVERIGEPLTLQLLDREAVHGQVRWWRDGRMGIGFGQPLE